MFLWLKNSKHNTEPNVKKEKNVVNTVCQQRRKTFRLSSAVAAEELTDHQYESVLDDARKKNLEKESRTIEKSIIEWISACLGEEPPDTDTSLHDYLKDGTKLCSLLNKFHPGAIKKMFARPVPYQMLDNISQFLEKCASLDLVPDTEHFLTVDLFEKKNMIRVTNFLLAFQGAHSTEEQQKDQYKPQPVVSSQQLQEIYQKEKMQQLQQQQDEMDKISREITAELKLKKAKNLLKKEKERAIKLEEEKNFLTQTLKEVENKNKNLEKEMMMQKQESEKKLQRILSGEFPKQYPQPKAPHSLAIAWSELIIKRRINGGGFAEIFEAEYYGAMVAVKKFLDKGEGTAKKELEIEVEILSNLHSPNIISLLGYCTEPPCLVMEYCPKGSLAFMLWNAQVSLTWKRRWKFAHEIALALHYMHTRNPPILHRDIKAGNFLIRGDWNLLMCDFGCSIRVNEKREESFIGGTLAWTSPEVLDANEYTEKADIYSYGMVLYEIAARQEPWHELSSPAQQLLLRQKIGQGERPSMPPGTPPKFWELAQACWKQDPAERISLKKIIEVTREFIDEDDMEDDVEQIQEKMESLQEEVEVQKMLCNMARKRAEEAEASLENEINLGSESKRKLIELEVSVEQYQREIASLKESGDKVKEQEKRSTQKASGLEVQLSDAERKLRRLEKRLERYQKRETEDEPKEKSKSTEKEEKRERKERTPHKERREKSPDPETRKRETTSEPKTT